jgi:hypothetical protein
MELADELRNQIAIWRKFALLLRHGWMSGIVVCEQNSGKRWATMYNGKKNL